jgi:hypothetical protein
MLWSVIQTGVALAKLDTMNQRLEKSEHNGNLVKEIGDSVGKDLATIAKDKKELMSGGDE